MPVAKTNDGCEIHFEVHGPSDAPAMFVGYPWCTGWAKVQTAMFGGNQAALNAMLEMNRHLIDTLASRYKVINIEYPRGCAPTTGPLPGDLSAETVTNDYVAVADAAGVDKFVAVGYSWSASFGIQVASRSPRCAGAMVGAWPAIDAPHEQLRQIVLATAKMAPAGSVQKSIMESNANYYSSIIGDWDQKRALEAFSKLAGRLYLFVGGNDSGVPGMVVPIGKTVIDTRETLEANGWKVDVFDGLDHMTMMLNQPLWLGRAMAFFENKTW